MQLKLDRPATHKCHARPLYPKIFEASKKTWKGDGMDKEDPKLYLNQLVMVEYTFQHPTNLAVVKQALPGTSYHIGGSEFQDSEWVQCCLFSVLFIREFVMSILQQCYLDDLMF